MNVLLLSQFFSTTRGGGEYVFYIIAKKLAENNHKVWVITNRIEGEQYESQKNIQIVFIPPTLKYKGGLPPKFSDNIVYSINAVITGLKIIKKEKIDVIHSNNFSPALSGSMLSFLSSKPHITTIHDVFSVGDKDFWKKWAEQNDVSTINARLVPTFEKLLMHLKYRFIHTGSEATKDDLVKFGAKKPIYVIPYTIEYPKAKIRNSNQFHFIYVGRLVFYKNLEVILKAIDLARKSEPKIKLIVVGDGPHREFLEKFSSKLNLENNVEFKGFVNNDVKEELIAGSNALLFPSIFEGFGLVILEAFGQYTPAIVSNLKPMSDIVTHGSTGYVLNPNNENEWAECILKLTKNYEESKKMGENGNELLKTKYNVDFMYQKIISMYEDVTRDG